MFFSKSASCGFLYIFLYTDFFAIKHIAEPLLKKHRFCVAYKIYRSVFMHQQWPRRWYCATHFLHILFTFVAGKITAYENSDRNQWMIFVFIRWLITPFCWMWWYDSFSFLAFGTLKQNHDRGGVHSHPLLPPIEEKFCVFVKNYDCPNFYLTCLTLLFIKIIR